MEGMDELARLVDQLQAFFRGHVEGTGEQAAATMLAFLRGGWIPAEDAALISEPLAGLGRDELALIMVQNIGELADRLLGPEEPGDALAWARSNLILDFEQYLSAPPAA